MSGGVSDSVRQGGWRVCACVIALSGTIWEESVSGGDDSVQHGGWRVCAHVIALSGTMWEERVSGGVSDSVQHGGRRVCMCDSTKCDTVEGECE